MHGWRIGRLFGINIEIHFTWLIIFGLILSAVVQQIGGEAPETSQANLWVTAVITTLLFFICLILHELSHSLMANHLGADVSRITLFVFGGVSQMTREPDNPPAEFKIAIVGPLTSLALAGLFYVLYRALSSLGVPQVWWEAAHWVAYINLALAVFNMLPGFPLDGGRVLRSILWNSWNSLERATKFASTVGTIFGYIMIGGGFLLVLFGALGGFWFVALGWLLSSAASSSYEQLQIRRALGDVHVHDIMSSPVETIPADVTLEQAADDYFMQRRFNAFGVEDGGSIVGVIRMKDLQQTPRDRWSSVTVREAMQQLDEETMTVRPDEEAVDAMMQM
ncbi:MAG: site-2 protease family protein, partial [Armatimonadota bacterium]